MVPDQASDQVALRLDAQPVDDSRRDRDQRRAPTDYHSYHLPRGNLRALVRVRLERPGLPGRRQREERRRDYEPGRSVRGTDVDDGLEPADVDAIEIGRILAPHAHERGGVNHRIHPAHRGAHGGVISHVPVETRPGKIGDAGARRANTVGCVRAGQAPGRWPGRDNRSRRSRARSSTLLLARIPPVRMHAFKDVMPRGRD
jgi:hypothetical protein